MLKVQAKDVINQMNVVNNNMNISEKYKFIWIAPERTGSRKIAEILNYYGFKYNNKSISLNGNVRYSHNDNIDYNYNYKVICNARNPYGRTYSIFKNFYSKIKDKSKNGFKEYLLYDLPNGQMKETIVRAKVDKPFEYVIRLEHMKDDLMMLPFISDVLTKSQIEMLTSHGKEIEDWKEFYDDEMKEIVYGYTKHQFELWGYEK
jgi:hypothetical protein